MSSNAPGMGSCFRFSCAWPSWEENAGGPATSRVSDSQLDETAGCDYLLKTSTVML